MAPKNYYRLLEIAPTAPADAVKRAMAAFGAKTDRIETVSFGEDKPKSNGHDESAWAENRRVDAVLKSR